MIIKLVSAVIMAVLGVLLSPWIQGLLSGVFS